VEFFDVNSKLHTPNCPFNDWGILVICADKSTGGVFIGTAVKAVLVLTLALISVSAANTPSDQTPVRRYLLSAGANNGGKDRVLLRYAESDARAFAAVLTDMGGVYRGDAFILANPSGRELLGGIVGVNRLIAANKAKEPNVRNEVFIYYSGHADVDGLKLGSETLSWADFRKAVNGIGADIRVAVLDACGSGAITRTKGGVAQPAFLSDASSNMKGYAFLTSSNENEASQESDRIKGSYFTHALLSGLRGAADLTGDGRVTINEAYQYAFNETLQNTQNTTAGTQHPSRDMNLAGTGDIVMTDLRETSAILSLDADIEGRFFIRDASGNLIAELRKMKGRAIDLGIAPGKYSVQMEAPSRRWTASAVTVTEGRKTTLTMNDMTAMARRERTVRRGGGEDSLGLSDSSEIAGADDYIDDDGIDGDGGSPAREFDELLTSGATADTSSSSLSSPADSLMSTASSGTPLPPRPLPVINPMLDSACRAPYRVNTGIIIASSSAPEKGLQFSLLVNHAREPFCGTQVSVLANSAGADMNGAQVSAGINISLGGGRLTQAAPVNIVAQDLNGTQVGPINLARSRVEYVQAGAVNFAGAIGYVQAGAVNIADSAGRVQAGAVNFADNVRYVQAGAVNVAGTAGSVQAGAVNIAGNSSPVQAGAVNIAGNVVRPVGLVNIAGHSEKTPIGLINIIGNGILDVTCYIETSGDVGASLRTGTPWLYTLIEYNQPIGYINEWPKWAGAGIGTRFGLSTPLTVNADALWATIYYDHRNTFFGWPEEIYRQKSADKDNYWFTDYLLKFRLGGSATLSPFMALTAGASVNARIDGGARRWWADYLNNPDNLMGGKDSYAEKAKKASDAKVWPEFYFGVTLGRVNPPADKK